MLPEWLIYQPPKSVSFGHQARLRDPRRAWPAVQAFLAGELDCRLDKLIYLGCKESSQWTEEAVAAARVAEARQLFGPDRGDLLWELDATQLDEAIGFALDDDRYPKQQLGPVRVFFGYRFQWRGLPHLVESGETRDPTCTLGVHIGARSLFLQPDFRFAAAWNAAVTRDFIAALEPRLPFRLRDQYFKRWLPPKGGGKSVFGRILKLDRAWRTTATEIVRLQ